MTNIFEFFKPRSGLSQARMREKEALKRMNELLKYDLATFKKGLKELGFNEGDKEYEEALKVYEATS
jgi:hypothetical protein